LGCTIITRGPMIVRDLDVLTEAARRAKVSITFSIPTLDEDVWRKTEPGTSPPRQRLRAVKALVDAGIEDVLLAYPTVGEIKIKRLMALMERASQRGVEVRSLAVQSATLDDVQTSFDARLERQYGDLRPIDAEVAYD